MIVENVPLEFLHPEEPTVVFSDDSRTLLPDLSVTDLLTRHKGFEEGTVRPNILYINNTTLLILFNDNIHEEFLGSVLLIVVNLNFSVNSFSIVDSKLIKDCYSKGRLVKSDDRFLIIHTFAVDTTEFEDGDQFLGYFTFSLHDDYRLKIHKNRTVFDFDYQNSG
uniref:Uncharacterized protein n=1 Tax=Panagrolaimus superbus TaxID=310955 RepID=A0A914YK23_9BILA